MNDDKMIDMGVEADRELFVGKTLESVTRKQDGVEYRFKGGGYFWHRSHIPINEHKLALLEKALDMCGSAYNNCLGGTYQPSTSSDWIKWAARDISTSDKWAVTQTIEWPEWVVERQEAPNGIE